MGVVVAAMHEQLRQRVAIKLLLPEAKASPNALARFLREARAAATIQGEHVARVLDVGELEGGVALHRDGVPRGARPRGDPGGAEPRPLPAEEAVDYVLQACEAIAEAHAAGIVHRDLKPSNLFLSRRPDGSPLVKVLDFGISKALLSRGRARARSRRRRRSSGSPIYSPPEQLVAAHDVDARADIWSLGTILYEALAGRPPFVGDSVMHVASKIFNEAPTPLGELRPELSAGAGRGRDALPREEAGGSLPGRARPRGGASRRSRPRRRISAERVARIVLAGSTPVSGPSPLRGSQSGASASVAVTARPASARVWIVGVVALTGVGIGFVLFSGRTTGAPAPPASISLANAPTPPPGSSEVLAATAPSASSTSADVADAAPPAPQVPAGTASQRPSSGAPPHKNPLSVGVK